SNAVGYPMNYAHPSEIMDEIASLTPTFTGVSFDRIEELGSIQWPCNAAHPEGTPTMHIGEFVRGKGKFLVTEYVPTAEKVNARYPLILTTGRILSQYNVGAQTRRTENSRWHDEDRLEIHPHDAEERGIKMDDWVGIESRAGETVLRYKVTAVQVMPVEQPSQWQKDYSRFNTEQLDLLRQRELANATSGK